MRISYAAAIVLQLGFLVSGGAVFAADVPIEQSSVDPGTPPPAFSWTGFYAGVNGGVPFDGYGQMYMVNTWTASGQNLHEIGPAFGGQVGYNYQFSGLPWVGDHLVLGAEAYADWSDVKGSVTVPTILGATTFGTRIGSFGAILGRLGYSFDRLFLYFQSGLPYAVTTNYYSVANGGPSGSATVARFQFGRQIAVGLGAEYAITDQWSIRVDYLYSYVRAAWLLYNYNPGDPADFVRFSTRTSFHTARLGLDYHFDLFAPPAPVVAKY